MKVKLKKLYHIIRARLSLKNRIILDWYRANGYILNLKNPKTFGEKIQWIKIYGNLEKYTEHVDKYKVRKYIKDTIGEYYLIKLIGVYNSTDEIDFNSLPDRFVLKLNYGAGYNIIVKNKNDIDIEQIKLKLNEWMKEDFYIKTNEVQYKNIERKIICEEYIEDESGELKDYKFFCFNGKVELIQVDTGRFDDIRRDYYNLNWDKLSIKKGAENSCKKLDKPKNLEKMIEIAQKLSKGIPMVRVDLYYVDDKIYFGELTFTPANGTTDFEPKHVDKKMADMIVLKNY